MNIFDTRHFNIENVPNYPCPTCLNGSLEHSSHKLIENASTVNARDCDAFDYEWVTYVIQAELRCNSKPCNEIVLMVGTGYVEENYDVEDWRNSSREFEAICTPEYFVPTLKVFNIPDYVPGDVRDILEQSFSLFFVDPDSCGNKIRASLEIILDCLKIPDGNLHHRINKLDGKYEKIKTLLMGAKWLGNAGSHGNKALTQNDLVKAYKIITVLLDLLFKPAEDFTEVYAIAESLIETFG